MLLGLTALPPVPDLCHACLQVYDTSNQQLLHSGAAVVSPGASLTWCAFSDTGVLATVDSRGMLRLRTAEWGGGWVPVLNSAAVKAAADSDLYWPVAVNGTELTCVLTTPAQPQPAVSPVCGRLGGGACTAAGVVGSMLAAPPMSCYGWCHAHVALLTYAANASTRMFDSVTAMDLDPWLLVLTHPSRSPVCHWNTPAPPPPPAGAAAPLPGPCAAGTAGGPS